MVHNVRRNLLVETTQKDGAHDNCHVIAEARKEARTLECNVARTDDQRLPGARRLAENVVGREAQLLVTWNAQVIRPTADGNHDALAGDDGRPTIFFRALNLVRANELAARIDI